MINKNALRKNLDLMTRQKYKKRAEIYVGLRKVYLF